MVDLQKSNLARFIVNVCNSYASKLLIHTNVCLYFLVLEKVGAKLTLQGLRSEKPTQNILKMMNGYEKYLHFFYLGNVSGMNHFRLFSSSV